jgi:hypothetical protein
MFFRVFYYGFGGLDDRFMVLLSPMLEQMAVISFLRESHIDQLLDPIACNG